jgi:predicted negative regulator of RcsB-dependent stress response
MKKIAWFFLLAAHPCLVKASSAFSFTPQLVAAYHDIMALRLEKGISILEKDKESGAPAVALIEDYAYFLTHFIEEDAARFEKAAKGWEKRYAVIKAGDKSSPYYRFACAEMLAHQAMLRFKYEDYQKGAYNIREAYLLLKENERAFPDFLPQKKSIGLLEVLVGTIPPKYSWIGSMLGMTGNIESGMKKLEEFLEAEISDPAVAMFQKEALFLTGFLQLHIIKDKEKAWKTIDRKTEDYRQDLLKTYVRSTIALHCKKTDEAIRVLENKPQGPEYFPFYYLDYLMGNAKLFRSDKDAGQYYLNYVSFYKGRNYIKDAYLKLAWHHLLQGNESNYRKYLSMIPHFGKAITDEDKQAEKEALQQSIPLKSMLKGRLLFDGGYYSAALQVLKSMLPAELRNKKEETEYSYRLARIYDEKGEKEKALSLYQETIRSGEKEAWYFAAYSSLHAGYIYSARGEKEKARKYFEAAMKYPNTEYKNSIDQKAKAALQKLKDNIP